MDSTDKVQVGYYAARVVMALLVVSSGSFGVGMLLGSSVVVNPGQKAVHTAGGQFQGVAGPGVHPGIPFWDSYTVFDMRQNLVTKTGDKAVSAVTADNINVKVSIKVRWDIADDRGLEDIYKNVAKSQSKLREKVVIPAVEEAPRLCANQMESEAVISTNRTEYKQCVVDRLTTSLSDEGLIVNSVEIVNMEYPDSLKEKFQKSRNLEEKKDIAEKKLEIARKESKAKVIRAEREAEAARKVRSALTDQYIRYIAVKDGLANANTVYVVPADGGTVPVGGEIPMDSRNGSSVNSSEVFGTDNSTDGGE